MAVRKIKENSRDSIDVKILQDLYDKIYEVLISDPEFGFENKKEVDDFVTPKVEVKDWVSDYSGNEGYFVEVRAELSYRGLSKLANLLTPILQKYDNYAYFDLEQPGIMNGVVIPERKSTFESSRRNYGGAYDIDSEMYFSGEEVREFAEQVAEDFSAETKHPFEVTDLDHTSNPNEEIYLELTSDDGYSVNAYVTVDLRKARYSSKKDNSNLLFRFKDEVMRQLRKQYSNLGLNESLKLKETLSSDDEQLIKIINDVYKKNGELDSEDSIREIETKAKLKGLPDLDADYLGDMITKSKDMIKTLDESLEGEDGWPEDVTDLFYDFMNRADDLLYELRVAVRGSMTGCSTISELADYCSRMAEDLENIASELESNEKELTESKKETLDEDSGDKDTKFKPGHVLDYI